MAQRRLVPVMNCIFESAQQVQQPLYTSMSVMGKSGVCEHVTVNKQFCMVKTKDRRDRHKSCVLNTVGPVVCDHGIKLDASSSNLKRGSFDF